VSAPAAVSVSPVPLKPGAFDGASLAIEAVVEDAEVKTWLLPCIENWLPEGTILATYTSSLSIELLARSLARPTRFARFHFLNPAHLTAVLEVVPGPETDQPTIDDLAKFGRRMGKRLLVLHRDVPGLVWNRLQFALLRECLYLLDQGIADVSTIDAAVSEGLAPRWLAGGPLATADLGGSIRSGAPQVNSGKSWQTGKTCLRRLRGALLKEALPAGGARKAAKRLS
jgi:3-hydroxybutyryl-CoA dehydrogenase